MMVLKRLEDAERDGDRIYAVIKGVAGSSDGKGKSMTAPRLEGQILALERAYARAGIRPSTVGLIEAHGTGTALGDASELAAVADVFLADGAAPQSCAIGSVKSMVGHTKSAAGITGLMKVALALYHKTLPPTLHVEKPNPKLLEPGTPDFRQHRNAAVDSAGRHTAPRRRQRVRIWRHQFSRGAGRVSRRPARPGRCGANREVARRAVLWNDPVAIRGRARTRVSSRKPAGNRGNLARRPARQTDQS